MCVRGLVLLLYNLSCSVNGRSDSCFVCVFLATVYLMLLGMCLEESVKECKTAPYPSGPLSAAPVDQFQLPQWTTFSYPQCYVHISHQASVLPISKFLMQPFLVDVLLSLWYHIERGALSVTSAVSLTTGSEYQNHHQHHLSPFVPAGW